MKNRPNTNIGPLRRMARRFARGFPDITLKEFLAKEWNSPLLVSRFTRARLFLRLWRRGFLSEAHYIYGNGLLRHNELLSDYARLHTKRINGRFATVLNDKLCFAAVVGRLVRTPANLAIITDGRVHRLPGSALLDRPDPGSAWRNRDVALKPIASGSGKGIHILRWVEGEPVLNGRSTDEQSIARFIEGLDEYLVTEFVNQSEYSAAFHPMTTNTIRILTMLCPEARRPFIATAVHRIGTSRSMPVDNWSRGGLCAEIDLETGELGAAVSFPIRGALERHDSHPETNQPINGAHVPNWTDIRDSILHVAEQTPFLRYVGWDVVVTQDGMCVLEGNNYSDVNLLQVHRPLLADPRVRAFYQHHGIIR